MRYYFAVQFRILNRHITDFGLSPVIGYLLAFLSFTGLSELLFLKTELADYIYLLIAFNIIFSLSNSERNKFLKTCFDHKNFYLIRITENLIVTLPFVIILLFQKSYLFAVLLPLLSGISVFFNFTVTPTITIPTPFYKKPFEFITGFRSSFFLIVFP